MSTAQGRATAFSREALRANATGYAVAIGLVMLAVAARFALEPALGERYPLLTFYVAVAAASWWAGVGPSVVVAALGYAAGLAWFPAAAPTATDALGSALYVALCGTLIGLTAAIRRERDCARAHAAQLETLLKLAPGIAVAVDPAVADVRISEPFRRLLQLPPGANAALGPSDVGGAPYRCVRGGVLLEAAQMPMQRAARERRHIQDQLTVELAQGERVHLMCEAEPLIDRDGRVFGAIGVHVDITAQVEAERRLAFALRAANAALWTWDIASGRVEYGADAVELFGLMPGETVTHIDAIGRNIHGDDLPTVRRQIEEIVAGRCDAVRTEFRVQHPTRGTRWLLGLGQVERDAEGRPSVVAGINLDVTDHRQAERALDAEREILRLVQEAGHLGVFEWDVNASMLHVSPALETLLGFAPGEFDGSLAQWESRVDAADLEVMRAARAQRWANRAADGDSEFRVRLPDGGIRWLHSRATYRFDPDGTVARVLGVTLDVTKQKGADLARAETERRFRRLAEAMPEIVYVTRADGAPEYVNPRWREYTGLDRADAAAAATVIPAEDWQGLMARWALARRARTSFSHEFRVRRAVDGAERWFLTRAVPMIDEGGDPEGWIGVSTDIHEQKLAQAALTEADRRKDEFLATLAHELRNPLAPVRYATRLLEPGTPPEMAASARQMIDRQLAQMARLLDDLLDVSRVTRGRLDLQTAVIDLVGVVSHAVDTARPLVEAVKHALVVRLPDQPVAMRGDATRLAQVLGNLLSNAAKYTEPGGRIDVTLDASPESPMARIDVRDSGIGIASEVLPRVFDLFMQADSGDRARSGLGIGLALAKQLAELHGGELRAASAGPGCGSTFTLLLPRLLEPPAISPGPHRREGVRTLFAPRCRILIADDNVDAAEALAHVLERAGYVPRTVHDGMAATEVAELLRPEIVLLDIGMPRMSGHEVARWIRAQPWGVTTRLIAITGWGQEDDRRRTKEAGFDAHLTKPVDPDELLERLAALGPARRASVP